MLRYTGLLVIVACAQLLSAASLTVTSSSDVVNGDVSSPERLIATPGSDGISLREAIAAANASPGPHTIGFATSLQGATITLVDTLPRITREGITIEGSVTTDGRPAVTLDASGLTSAPSLHVVVVIEASNVTIRRLRIRKVPQILQGAIGIDVPPARQTIRSVLVEENELDNTGYEPGPGFGPHGIKITTGGPAGPTPHALLADVTIRRNVLAGFIGDSDAILGGPSGEQSRMENVAVEQNTFRNCTFGVEIGGHTGPGVLIRGVRIRDNHFETFSGAIVAGVGSDGNRFEDLEITGNSFSSGNAAILLGPVEGPDTVMSDVVVSRNEFNGVNLVVVPQCYGVRNRFSDITITRNIARGPGGGLNVRSQGEQCIIERIEVLENELSAVSSFGPEGHGDVIRDVVIARNRNANRDYFLSLSGSINGENCTLRNVIVSNNATSGGVDMRGGFLQARNSAIENVQILNNTFVTDDVSFAGARAFANAEGATGNEIRGLEIANCIIHTPGADFEGEIQVSQVHHCLVGDAAFGGNNQNVFGDPGFVDATRGDFRLRAGSSAIDRGATEVAPPTDLECRPRVGPADVGAFEFGSAEVARLELEVASGSGSVSSLPDGYDCGPARSLPVGSTATLLATPSSGWRFAGWSGDDDCLDGSVTMLGDRRCMARFVIARRRAVRQ